MKKYKNNIWTKFSIIGVLVSFMACEDFVNMDLTGGELSSELVFKDSVNAEAAVIGMYLNVNSGALASIFGGAATVFPGLAGDELFPSNASVEYLQFYENGILTDNSLNSAIWLLAYKQIYLVNACLEGLDQTVEISERKRNQLIGEILQIRATNYFYLTQLYGDVPLILSTDYRANYQLPRTAQEQVYQQIIEDLTSAQQYLVQIDQPTTRANYYSATALLAKVYLSLGLYAEAEKEANKVIMSGKFSLMEDVVEVFSAESKETIWAWEVNDQSNTGMQTFEGLVFVPTNTSVIPQFTLQDPILDLFVESDERYVHWIGENVINGVNYHYPRKYHVARTVSRRENYIISRLAEQYLIRAECRLRDGEFQLALVDLNTIRQRAGLEPYSATIDSDLLLDHILTERRRELFCEWGSRWFDLKRLGLLDETMQPYKEWWSASSGLFPVPKNELDYNPFLTQNPGY